MPVTSRRWITSITSIPSIAVGALIALGGCQRDVRSGGADSNGASATVRSESSRLLVMNAAAVTLPLRAVLDSFSARTGIAYDQEPGASLEVARRITEAGRRPDVVILADPQVFPALLMPRFTSWYALFGRNRIVLAYTAQSRGATEISPENWRRVVLERGVEIGRADPNTDPSGYRTLLVFQLAERFYREPGLAQRLLAAAPSRNVRPREADQVALLQAHELDYIWTYENLAQNHRLSYVKLPSEVDLGSAGDSASYATAVTRVLGKKPGDTLSMRGAPILFAATILDSAAHRSDAERFVRFLVSNDGKRILRGAHFDALDEIVTVGTRAPSLAPNDSAR